MYANRAWWIPAEDGGTEREYFWPYINSELGLKLIYGGSQREIQLERIRNYGHAIIFIDSSVKNFNFLRFFPKKSVIIFQMSDETYSTISTLRLLSQNAVFKVYRDYPIRSSKNIIGWPLKCFRKLISALNNNISIVLFARALLAGLVIACRQLLIRFASKFLGKLFGHIPLGYTNNFDEEYRRIFSLEENVSLVKFALNQIESSKMAKSSDAAFFAGQRGNFDRQLMIAEARSGKQEVERIYEKFAASDIPANQKIAVSNYVQGIMRSKFSICPPGNYSAESFRYLESLLLQSFPLQADFVLTDPLFRNSLFPNWSEYLKSLADREIDSFEVVDLIKSELINHKQKIDLLVLELKIG
jgi:hypothetical protein